MKSLDRAHNIDDLGALARRRLPRPIYDYLIGGADDEVSLRRNRRAFDDYELLPETMVDVSTLRTGTVLFGREIAWPLMLAPTGLTRMFHASAEIAVARAAARHGLPYALSTMGTTSIETLADAFPGPRVFQIYIFRDRGLTTEFVARCRTARYDGLVLTVDTPVAGNRERDRRSGLSLPPRLTLRSMASFARHPLWSLSALSGTKFDLANVSHRVDALGTKGMSLFDYIGGQFDPSVTWADVERLATAWNGPLAIKGIMTAADARRAIDCGATGVIVSNHGGRQLDGTPAPVDQIAGIRDALGSGPDIILDGGIRRGSDLVKALVLGATAGSIGRPYLYGLAAGGEAGVDRALSILRDEFHRTLTLSGAVDIAQISRHLIQQRRRWSDETP